MPGPEPPVTNGLQIDQSLEFQRRFRRVQKLAWRVLALLPVAAVAGLFGGGLFSQTTAGSAGATVSYERFGRRSVDTQLEVTVARARRPVAVSVSRAFLDGYDVSEVRPPAERVTAHADRLVFDFTALAGASVSFTLTPKRLGSGRGTVTVAGSRPVRVHQFVYP
ncbi:hypothetical protein OJ997_09745 [Solirubrobacter phytolaccae]|uniref:Uncharacterized protein n=1 Tax=Solirubrobacter phytolaccae TaxID=1404360 RepID=A0A9X3S726_9ACTN|nr:hypothetical protein [Solirubrobacter phytolaccae]MDA0180574.1 hypothetical protein [Solirubrobacter phytolaccae]